MNLSARATYATNVPSGIGELTLVVRCDLGGSPNPQRAFVDTGAKWSILPGDFAVAAGIDPDGPGLGHGVMETRLGRMHGTFERAPLRLLAETGEDAEIDVTWFVSPDWYGPIVIGWQGGLDRFRWGLDPADETFHFEELG
jgi:hypothetical protein